jgi:hypothetical protein
VIELRRDDVGSCLVRLGDAGDDAVAIAVEVADDRVDLGQGNPHRFSPQSL